MGKTTVATMDSSRVVHSAESSAVCWVASMVVLLAACLGEFKKKCVDRKSESERKCKKFCGDVCE